jgi:hypothetical protein
VKDCMEEWADRVDHENLHRVLELGEFLLTLPANQKPFRMTMAASKLAGEGVARSQEEAYTMLTDACVQAALLPMAQAYDEELKKAHRFVNKVMKLYKKTLKENNRLQALVDQKIAPFRVLPEKRKVADA